MREDNPDILIIGGGVGGCPAAIAAAREKTTPKAVRNTLVKLADIQHALTQRGVELAWKI